MALTRINNAFIDNLRKFSSTETKLLLVIARFTIGANKKTTKISLQKLHEHSGCAIETTVRNLKALVSKGIIRMEKESKTVTTTKDGETLEVQKQGKEYHYELLKESGLIFDPSATNLLAVENSFTPINNTFLENLHIFTSPQVKILLTIARYTFGSNIPTAQISMVTFKGVAGVEPKVLLVNVATLEKGKFIAVSHKNNKKGNTYQIIDKDILPFGGENKEEQGLFDSLGKMWTA